MRFHLRTHAFSKTSTLGIVFENLRFQWRLHHFSVDGRQKRMEKDTFSNENVLVWTEPKTFSFENASFSMRFRLPSALKR